MRKCPICSEKNSNDAFKCEKCGYFFQSSVLNTDSPLISFEKEAVKTLWYILCIIVSLIMIPLFWLLFKNQALAFIFAFAISFFWFKCTNRVINLYLKQAHKDE